MMLDSYPYFHQFITGENRGKILTPIFTNLVQDNECFFNNNIIIIIRQDTCSTYMYLSLFFSVLVVDFPKICEINKIKQ